jgi:hypothetical protein
VRRLSTREVADVARIRFTIRRMMKGVVIVSLIFALVRTVSELRYWTITNGWNTSVLDVGQQVAPCLDIRVGNTSLPAWTLCTVVEDLTDTDSAYPDRKVTVQIADGRLKGTICGVRRSLLRVR